MNSPAGVSSDGAGGALIAGERVCRSKLRGELEAPCACDADTANHCIRRVRVVMVGHVVLPWHTIISYMQVFANGTIATVVGFGSAAGAAPTPGFVDGVPASLAKLSSPQHIVVDPSGNWFISGMHAHASLCCLVPASPSAISTCFPADTNNNCIRRVVVSTMMIGIFAGTGTAGERLCALPWSGKFHHVYFFRIHRRWWPCFGGTIK